MRFRATLCIQAINIIMTWVGFIFTAPLNFMIPVRAYAASCLASCLHMFSSVVMSCRG